jgi:hypothetical protein
MVEELVDNILTLYGRVTMAYSQHDLKRGRTA